MMMSFLDYQTSCEQTTAESMMFYDPVVEPLTHQPHVSQFDLYNYVTEQSSIPDPYPTSFHYASSPSMGGTSETGFASQRGVDGFDTAKKLLHTRLKVNNASACKYGTEASFAITTSHHEQHGERQHRAADTGRRSTGERRDRINERERERMHMLCDAFERLRQVLPFKKPKRGPHRQKLSKISTLVLAQNYIQTLEDILRNPGEYSDCRLSSEKPVVLSRPSARTPTSSDGSECSLFNSGDYYQQHTEIMTMEQSLYPY
ncbi:uncharacterized protein [Asterias amurensis]|uniref:uncharacterized protein n=1 Tax=Asterias amurensis TaxID=7602 RepID=UPI003AB687E2